MTDTGNGMVVGTLDPEIGKAETIKAVDDKNDGRQLQKPCRSVQRPRRGVVLQENAYRVQKCGKGNGSAPGIPGEPAFF